MSQASVTYAYNEEPSRGLALAGAIFFLKAILLFPHLIVVGILGWLAGIVGYIGFWIVTFTGKMPDGIASILDMYLRWYTRTSGWLYGIADEYPPFESDPSGYAFEAVVPRNENPSRGLALAGALFMVKAFLLIPHFIALFVLYIGVMIATWVGYLQVVFTGELSTGIQDFQAGVSQWVLRIMSWLYGMTDEYPPFSMEISPAS